MTDMGGLPNPADQDDLIPAVKKKMGMRAQGLKPHVRLDQKPAAKSPPMSHAKAFAGLK